MPTPNITYKYRDWKDDYHIRFLSQREIYLASPSDINDPYDCTIPNDLSLLDTDEKRGKFIDESNFNQSIKPSMNRALQRAARQALIKKIKTNTEYFQNKLERIYLEKGDRYFGIFSTSLIWNNIQMWSYYSSNHSGFCVGLDGNLLFDSLPSCKSAPVNYPKDFPKIDPLGDFIQNSFESTHTKDINWKHEKEYRYFCNLNIPYKDNNSRIITLPKDCFKELIIGLKFPDKDIDNIRQYADVLEVPLYKIKKSNKQFKLNRIKI